MKKIIALAALMCGTAHADFLLGNDLFSRLQSDKVVERAVGLGYVMGVFDVGQNITHCAPANVTSGQIKDMVQQHLDSVPAARHMAAESHVSYILGKTWPCAKKGTSL